MEKSFDTIIETIENEIYSKMNVAFSDNKLIDNYDTRIKILRFGIILNIMKNLYWHIESIETTDDLNACIHTLKKLDKLLQ